MNLQVALETLLKTPSILPLLAQGPCTRSRALETQIVTKGRRMIPLKVSWGGFGGILGLGLKDARFRIYSLETLNPKALKP